MKRIINKMKKGGSLTYEEIKYIVDSYVSGDINDANMSKFLMLIYNNGLTYEETCFLTDVMVKSGDVLDLSSFSKPCVDKHSTGGIGDKVTLIVSPIVASLGIIVPKMSGRGLGITGGTADKLESIPGFKVNISKKMFFKELREIGLGVISQSEKIAVADKKIYALRNEIGAVDSSPLIASSIMSKKIASGAENIVIDLKVGKGAFMKNIKSASMLAKNMIEIGKYYNKNVICTLTDMNAPLGRNIGNALEVEEVIDFFNGNYDKRLYMLCVYIATLMVSISKNISFRNAKKMVIDSIESGSARRKFRAWIRYQGGNLKKFKVKANKLEILSNKSGYVNGINAQILGELVFYLGAGRINKNDKIDYNVGVSLNKGLGDKVLKGEVITTVYYNKPFDDIEKIVRKSFNISDKKKKIKSIIIKTMK